MTPEHITILGGGPAGLAVGYFAKQRGIPFTIFEASSRAGGNCSTYQHGEFLLDSGAHRFHDKNPQITQEVLALMGGDLLKISVPSQIYRDKKFIDFPLSPFNLMKKLGVVTFGASAWDLLVSRCKGMRSNDFASFAEYTYGRKMAELFLLNYSKKLWGMPCHALSRQVSGKRMKGLDLKTFLKETLVGHHAKTEHLDGAFYYPKYGYGMIADRLAECCGRETLKLNSRVTKIGHDHQQILSLTINDKEKAPVHRVVNTLPISLFLQLMDPAIPQEINQLSHQIKFRHVILAAIFLDKPSVTDNGSVYFPEDEFPFTRVYEPRNRSALMAPPGKTSLVAEIPCFGSDPLWREEEASLIAKVCDKYKKIGWVNEGEIIGGRVFRLSNAYPVLELGFERKLEAINQYLGRFQNLKSSGRGGKFVYSWLHDMMQFGKDIVSEY